MKCRWDSVVPCKMFVDAGLITRPVEYDDVRNIANVSINEVGYCQPPRGY